MRDKIKGGLLGLLVGDALGVPYEFHEAYEIPPKELIEYEPPEGFMRAHGGVYPGTWSDDGAQALCLLESLLQHNEYHEPDFINKLCAWDNDGYMCVDNQKFDIGRTTANSLLLYRLGMGVNEASQDDEFSNGNGSLMRVLPLALWHTGSDLDLTYIAMRQSVVTHGHIRSQVCCAVYVLWARYVMEEDEHAWDRALSVMGELYKDNPDVIMELELINNVNPVGAGSGYVLDSLISAKMLIDKYDNYEDIVKEAIRLGDDTDTTACIAGGIAGIKYGVEGIPQRWRRDIRGKNIIRGISDRLLMHRGLDE